MEFIDLACPGGNKNPCSGNGVCHYNEEYSDAHCHCYNGFEGESCEIECPDCDMGFCVVEGGNAVCRCLVGFGGVECNIRKTFHLPWLIF
jgi:hypothetical protein